MGFYKVCVLLSDAQLKETNNILAGLNISHVRTRDCFILHTEEGECKSVFKINTVYKCIPIQM